MKNTHYITTSLHHYITTSLHHYITTSLVMMITFISFSEAQTQTPAILREWAKYAGNTDSVFKTPVITDGDYTYVATVVLNSATGPDIEVIKYYGSGGSVAWRTDWSGSGNARDQAADMVMDSEYLYVCGMTFASTTNNFDFLTMKINKSTGGIEWVNTFNGTSSNYDIATSIVETDTVLYVTGVANNTGTLLDYHTIKYNKDGTLLWQNDFDYNSLMDIPFDISLKDDTEIVVTGGSQSSITDWDYQTVQYDPQGGQTYANRVSGSAAGFDRAQAVKTDSSGNIYITGAVLDGGGYDIKTVKLTSTGSFDWANTYDNGPNDLGNDLIVDHDGIVYDCGESQQSGTDFFVEQIKADGTAGWTFDMDAQGFNDTARALCFDSYGNIVVTGQVRNSLTDSYDFMTIAFDTDGNEIWRDYFDGPYHGDDNATNIAADTNGNIYVTGQVATDTGQVTVTIKYRTDYFTQPPAIDSPSVACLFYPNSGQIVDVNDSDVTDSVHYFTLHHYPQLYFGYGVMNMVFGHIDNDTSTTDTLQRVDVTFLNSSNPTEASPVDEQDSSGYLNYFLAQCPNGITNVFGYGSLLYSSVYDGIDVIFSSNDAGLRLSFVCSPGTDPSEIGLLFNGQTDLSVSQNWQLNVHTLVGDYAFEKPRVYQIDGSNNRVALNWAPSWNIPSSGEANFTGWGSYDSGEPLVIEIARIAQYTHACMQNLCWSTYFGGTGNEIAGQITRDDKNNLYTVGETGSSSFPDFQGLLIGQTINAGAGDVLITKFSAGPRPGRNMFWSTFYGGGGLDEGRGIAVNNTSGEVYITGITTRGSTVLPTTNTNSNFYFGSHQGGLIDAFLVKLSNSGRYIDYATYIGGGEQDGGFAIAINQTDGSVYLGGQTLSNGTVSPSFPIQSSGNSNSYNQNVYGGNITGGLGDGFIMKFDPSDNLLWSTFFGGNGEEAVAGFTITDNGDVIVVGNTNSSSANSGTASPYCLANNNGQFQLCDQGSSAYFDNSLNNSPTLSEYDLFLAAFNNSDQLIWSTYFGGDNLDFVYECNPISTTYTPSGKYALTGYTRSSTSSFPVLYPANSFQQGYSGVNNVTDDAFIAVFTNEFELTWCTYYGGDEDEWGRGVTFDSHDNLYVTGLTYSTTPSTTTCIGPSGPTLGEFPVCDANSSFYFNTSINSGISSAKSDAFIASFDQNYSMIWSTYLGGSGDELGSSIIEDETINESRLFTYGNTSSPKWVIFPVVRQGGYYDQFDDLLGGNDNFISMFELDQTVGINKQALNNFTLQINPNPSLNNIDVLFNSKFDLHENKLSFEILDLNGRCLIDNFLEGKGDNIFQNKINIENLSSGMYFLKIHTSEGVLATKFIKQ